MLMCCAVCRASALLAVLLLTACQQPAADAVATHRGATLTRAELDHHLPKGLSAADSAARAADYIAEWTRDQVLLQTLADSLPELMQAHRWGVEDYRRKLAQHLVLEALVRARVDTTVTAEQLAEAYAQRRGDFLAQTPQLQVLHLAADAAPFMGAGQARIAEVQRALTGPREQLPARLGPLAAALDSGWVTPAQLGRYGAPANVNLLAAPGRAVLVYPDAQRPRERLHFFYVAGLVNAGEPLPLPLVAPLLRQLVVAQRRQAFVEAYQRQLAPPS